MSVEGPILPAMAVPTPSRRWTSARPVAMPRSKRLTDLALTFALLPLVLPLGLLVALAIRLDSRGPVFFVQKRVGFRGALFPMVKFRSMRVGAEAIRERAESDRNGPCYKAAQDPRVTRVGRWLRRSSLDELPQLWNVLRGDMSLVGPRPALPREVVAYPRRALRRLDSVPGLTGLWQVSGRADLDFDTMVELDLLYQEMRGFWRDLALLLRTLDAVFTGRGAY